jgi:hypothetical protein
MLHERTRAVPACALVLGLLAIAAITLLQQRSDSSRDAELKLARVKIDLNQLQTAPFRADPSSGGSPALAHRLMSTGRQRISDTLVDLRRQSPPVALGQLTVPLRADYAALDKIYVIGASGSGYRRDAELVPSSA